MEAVHPGVSPRLVPALAQHNPTIAHGHAFASETVELSLREMRRGPTARRDHPMPPEVRGIGAHDPSDDPGRGQPGGVGEVAVRAHLAPRNGADEGPYPLHIGVGDRTHDGSATGRTGRARP